MSQDPIGIEWGVLVTLPNGATDTELANGRGWAVMAADNIERRIPGSTARLVYRTVNYGDWTTDYTVGGDLQWGCRESWSDGHVEVRDYDARHRAEFSVTAGGQLASTRTLVARTRQVGDWWLAEVAA